MIRNAVIVYLFLRTVTENLSLNRTVNFIFYLKISEHMKSVTLRPLFVILYTSVFTRAFQMSCILNARVRTCLIQALSVPAKQNQRSSFYAQLKMGTGIGQ